MNHYTQLLAYIKTLLEQDSFVNTITQGEMSKTDLNKMDIYPLAHVYIGDGNFTNGQSVNFNVTISSATQINTNKEINTDKFYGNDNEVDCYNETLSVLNRLWTTMYRDFQEHGIYASENPSLTKSKGDENTLVGWQLDFQVVMPNRTLSLCDNKYVLDLISVLATAAYGLRRLYTSWTGAAIRVRRSSDDAEADIGFKANGDLDTVALLDFVGNGSGFVTTWYDQSGNGHHATQGTAANQPQIVSNGVIETQNGRPAVVFDGVDDRLATVSTTLGITSSATLVVVTQPSSRTPPAQGIVGSDDLNTRFGFFITGINTMRWNPMSFNTIEASSVTSAQILVGTAQSGAKALFRNGTSIATGTDSTGTMSSTPFNIGNMLPGTTLPHFSGTIAEVVAFPSVLSTTDRQTLERNQGLYFNISVS
jgi:hypothetical protein